MSFPLGCRVRTCVNSPKSFIIRQVPSNSAFMALTSISWTFVFPAIFDRGVRPEVQIKFVQRRVSDTLGYKIKVWRPLIGSCIYTTDIFSFNPWCNTRVVTWRISLKIAWLVQSHNRNTSCRPLGSFYQTIHMISFD